MLGCVDALEAVGIPCFGPRKNAAILEGSKVFSKDLMKKYGIPTAEYRVFDKAEDALEYLKEAPIPTVVKADGLALGKGVTVAMTREEAEAAVREAMEDKKFGASGDQIVIEEYLEGPEVSVLSFTDGTTVVPMISSMDHKRAGTGIPARTPAAWVRLHRTPSIRMRWLRSAWRRSFCPRSGR